MRFWEQILRILQGFCQSPDLLFQATLFTTALLQRSNLFFFSPFFGGHLWDSTVAGSAGAVRQCAGNQMRISPFPLPPFKPARGSFRRKLMCLRFGRFLCIWGRKFQTIFQTFRTLPGYPSQVLGYSARKFVLPGSRGTYRTFWPPPLHVEDPQPTGKISGPTSLSLCSLFLPECQKQSAKGLLGRGTKSLPKVTCAWTNKVCACLLLCPEKPFLFTYF